MHSSVELGYRATDITGSGDMYDTLVDLQQGPRLLDQTLSMQSLDHQGILFDRLYLNSFGWGGDPNNALRHPRAEEQVVQPRRQFPPRPEFFRLRPAGESPESIHLHSHNSRQGTLPTFSIPCGA